MPRFDRYLLSQLMVAFGFFSLILVLVYWINRAVILFDRLIADGQSAWVFLEFTALTLPNVIKLVLPMSAFAAALYVTNRMSSESELTVVQATGYSPLRLARPVLVFGVIVALLMSVLVHVLVPMSQQALAVRQAEVSANTTARLLKDGQFLTPTDGITLYIREITPEGELLNLFLSDTTSETESVTYTAARAFLVSTDKGPQLVMIDGMIQTFQNTSQRLFTTTFEDFAFDIGSLVGTPGNRNRRTRDLLTSELFSPSLDILAETGKSQQALFALAHDRIAETFLSIIAALLGFATLLTGGFSRFGLWKQMVSAIFLVIVVKGIETAATNAARSTPELWYMVYLPFFAGMALVAMLLLWATNPHYFKRRGAGRAPAPSVQS